jgi:hypothetical protein
VKRSASLSLRRWFLANLIWLCQTVAVEATGSEAAAADVRQMVQILWALPGDSAFRRNSADVVVRYLGGDPRLIQEVLSNRAVQEVLMARQPNHPARVGFASLYHHRRRRVEGPHARLCAALAWPRLGLRLTTCRLVLI